MKQAAILGPWAGHVDLAANPPPGRSPCQYDPLNRAEPLHFDIDGRQPLGQQRPHFRLAIRAEQAINEVRGVSLKG